MILVAASNIHLASEWPTVTLLALRKGKTLLFKWKETFCLTWSVLFLKNEDLERSGQIHKESCLNEVEVIIWPCVVKWLGQFWRKRKNMKGDLKIGAFQKIIFSLLRAFPGKERIHLPLQNQASKLQTQVYLIGTLGTRKSLGHIWASHRNPLCSNSNLEFRYIFPSPSSLFILLFHPPTRIGFFWEKKSLFILFFIQFLFCQSKSRHKIVQCFETTKHWVLMLTSMKVASRITYWWNWV